MIRDSGNLSPRFKGVTAGRPALSGFHYIKNATIRCAVTATSGKPPKLSAEIIAGSIANT
jgi:hypothetical protein